MSATETIASFPLSIDSVAGVSLRDLARDHATPLYLYDSAVIAARIADLQRFDVVRYAQKAWPNIAMLDFCRRHGVVVDATSAGEVHRALSAGYTTGGDPPEVVYCADVFDRESLDLVASKNVHVNCGSIDMIAQYGERCPGHGITVRINPGFGHGHSQKTNTGGDTSKHGIWHEQLGDVVACAEAHDLKIEGVHVHIGSGSDMEHLGQVSDAVERIAAELGADIRAISAGGGIPTPYRDGEERVDLGGYFDQWDSARRRLEKRMGRSLRLEIEPGRYLAAEAGYLLTEIRAVKRQADHVFYLVDAGFNNLARPILYGAYHPMAIVGAADDAAISDVVVGGPLCESGDIFTQADGGFVRCEPLPAAKVGDLLVIRCAGAYGSTMGSNYNSKPLAAEVWLEDGEASVVRRRQTLEDLTALESIPWA